MRQKRLVVVPRNTGTDRTAQFGAERGVHARMFERDRPDDDLAARVPFAVLSLRLGARVLYPLVQLSLLPLKIGEPLFVRASCHVPFQLGSVSIEC